MAVQLKDKNGNALMLDDDSVEMESGKSLKSAVDDGDIGQKISSITETTTTEDTEEQIYSSNDETEEYVKIGSYGIKAKKFMDLEGNEIKANTDYAINQDYVYKPVYKSTDYTDWKDYDSDSRGAWSKSVDGLRPTAIGGYVSDKLCGATYLPNIYRSQYKICQFDVILYNDNILNIHFCRGIQTASVPNESMYKIDCVNKKLIMTKLNGREVTDDVLKEEAITIDITDGDKYSVVIVKKDLYFSLQIIDNKGNSNILEYKGDWQGGTQLESYGFSLGAGSTSLNISNFRVYLPTNVNAIIVGDSITEGLGMVTVKPSNRWSTLLARAIGNTLVSGASSGTVNDIVNTNYWDCEILKVKPKFLILMAGTNNSGSDATATATLSVYQSIYAKCKDNDIIPIFLHIPMMSGRTSSINIINSNIDTIGTDTSKVDVATAIDNDITQGCNTSLFFDGCHPNVDGSQVIIERIKLDLPFLFNHTI